MSSDNTTDQSVEPEASVTKNAPEKSGLGFSFSELWQNIPRPTSNPEKEAEVLVEKPPKIVMGKSYQHEDQFDQKVSSLIWLTYRTGFEPIPKNPNGPHPLAFVHSMVFNKNPLSTNIHSFVDNENFTTDVGWGCMIRTSQSLLANSYSKLVGDVPDKQQELLQLFRDVSEAPFSLHNFIRVANELPLQVKPGQWFGPNAASLSIQRLCNYVNGESFDVPKLQVLISETSDLYDEKIKLMLQQSSVLILLPIRLGVDKTNAFYFSSIFQLLNCEQSVGIAGGRPSSSFYFFGYDGEDLLYLDPHYPQNINQTDSYHTSRYQRLNINELDPSMMIGILCTGWEDYLSFKSSIESSNKIVHFAEKQTDDSVDVAVDFDDFEDGDGIPDDETDSYDIVK